MRLDGKRAYATVKRDHANHLSPNCAWSEAAAAGALGIQLGGTHLYFGKPVEKPTIGDALRPAEKSDITKTCLLLYLSGGILMLILLLLTLVL